MKTPPQTVGVLGAGTMGAQIAAHLANVGVEVVLLDLAEDGPDPNSRARAAIKTLTKMRPSPLFRRDNLGRIRVGNFRDDLASLSSCDWVIEAIAERLDWKQNLWESVEPHLKGGAIVSSNTSGLSIARIAEGRTQAFRNHWLGTHFFNPPRYMKLLEIIAGPETLPEVVELVVSWGDRLLGKGVVMAHDRPNFVANRIGAFAENLAMHLTQQQGLSFEDVDRLTGPLIGRPKTGTFRLSDLVGNDVMYHVSRNLYESLPEDPQKEILAPPRILKELVERGWNGRKTGQGFYKKEGREILVLDAQTMDYRPQQLSGFAPLEEALNEPDPAVRIGLLLDGKGAVADFLWPLLRDTFVYSAGRIPEVCEHLYQLDQALRWGYGWELGPFQLWDALGTRKIARRIQTDGVDLPEWVETLLQGDSATFYGGSADVTFFDQKSSSYQPQPRDEEKVLIGLIKARRPPILSNASASLVDMGEGVACLEFHSKLNSLDDSLIDLGWESTHHVEKNFRGLVIANQGRDFCVGANLVSLLQASRAGAWDEIDAKVRRFQEWGLRLKYAPFPVVAAPFQRVFGGGLEVCLACDSQVAAAEAYLGLVEVGVGLIPAGGGCKEMLARQIGSAQGPDHDGLSGLRRVFEIIGMAKVSGSAQEAREMRFLSPTDSIEISTDRIVHRAMQRVLGLSRGYVPPAPLQIKALGGAGLAMLRIGLHQLKSAGYLSEHDELIGRKLIGVLCGGDLNHAVMLPETRILELERQVFLSLCGEEKTQQRMEHLLKTGKPLRN